MKVVFVGGGSFRTLPIVRGTMSGENVLRDGEISLVDFNLERAETVGKLIQKTPEYAGSNCTINWTDQLDKALPGANLVSISFPVCSFETCQLSQKASAKHGFPASDQLSISGAFRSVTGGTIILDIAQRMEKYCPNAWLVSHANPVAVYSGVVNNHTGIKALGLCSSCYHPRWDLTRLLFDQDEYRDDYTFASAGVNHLTFLLRAKLGRRDVYKLLDETYQGKPWRPLLKEASPATRKTLHFSFKLLQEMRKRFGVITCSNEFDGTRHLFPEEFARAGKKKAQTTATAKALEKKAREDRNKADLAFRAHIDRELDSDFWAKSCRENPWFGVAHSDTTTVVIKALGSDTPQWLGASLPNNGAIKGFKDRAIVEYSFSLDRQGTVHPDADLEVPDCFHGLISSLSSHQTLLGDAIANRDPKLFAQALFAYPDRQNSKAAKALWRDLLKIHADEMPAEFANAKDYF